jgi:PiT family inorganic phosphate transporter
VAGGGVSTTHITSMSIIGAGAAESLSAVRWHFVRRVLVTWVLTIPATALLASLIVGALNGLGG